MNDSIFSMMKRGFLLLVTLVCVADLGRAEPLPEALDFLTMSGLRHVQGADRYAYLYWEGTDPLALAGRTLALYRKNGEPDAPGGFTRIALLQEQRDARTIAPMMPRAVKLGQDVGVLGTALDGLFEAFIPTGSVSLADKLAAVVSGTELHPPTRGKLQFFARSQPLLAMALGQAWADPLPNLGAFTYELREHDVAAGVDQRVVGRVTLDSTTPTELPAPGPAVQVLLNQDRVAEEHLAVHLRWGVPDALRARSPIQAGYRVYRVAQAYAEAQNWHVTPPSAALLVGARLVAPAAVALVNRVPVYPDQLLTVAQAADGMDSETYFLVDENHRFEEGASALPAGAGYYYFVVALDLLGREGQPSVGGLGVVRDRLKPRAPGRLRAVQEVIVGVQRLRVYWGPGSDAQSAVAQYQVYRWESLEAIQAAQGDALTGKIGTVVHGPATEFTLLDDGAGAPRHPPLVGQPAVTGRLFYYTVRTEDAAGNLSPHSAPVAGVLRDASAPDAPETAVAIHTVVPEVQFVSLSGAPEAALPEDRYHFKLICEAVVPGTMEWAEFGVWNGVAPAVLGRLTFDRASSGAQQVASDLSLEEWPLGLVCRVQSAHGQTSPWVQAGLPSAPGKVGGVRFTVSFNAVLNSMIVPADGETAHASIVPGTGERPPITLTVDPAPGTREVKVYRRVDGGELGLVASQQVADDAQPQTFTDDAVPGGNAEVCYYTQAFDEEGNGSALMPADPPCVKVASPEQMPVPFLRPLVAVAGPANAPRLRIEWVCAPHGVDRFELWIARGVLPAQSSWAGGAPLSRDLSETRPNRHRNRANRDFGVYQTVRASAMNAQEDGTLFSVELGISAGIEYDVFVRAVGVGGVGSRARGALSNFEKLTWTLTQTTPAADSPWIPRPITTPTMAVNFHPQIEAKILSNLGGDSSVPGRIFNGTGIVIGGYEYRGGKGEIANAANAGPTTLMPEYWLPGTRNPAERVFHQVGLSDQYVPLWPLVLYRVQVDSPSGQTTQVSPLMDQIAYVSGTSTPPDPEAITIIRDPFLCAKLRADVSPVGTNNYDLMLLDRTPVIQGATYRYFLARLGPDREVAEILVTNDVTY